MVETKRKTCAFWFMFAALSCYLLPIVVAAVVVVVVVALHLFPS